MIKPLVRKSMLGNLLDAGAVGWGVAVVADDGGYITG